MAIKAGKNALNLQIISYNNNVEYNKYEDKKILGVNVNEIVNAVIIILFIIGGIVLIALSIGGMN